MKHVIIALLVFRPTVSTSPSIYYFEHTIKTTRRLYRGSSVGAMNNRKILLQDRMEKREQGFNTTGLQSVKLKEYNALYDPNMRHFFETKHNQNLLYRTGQIDSHGRVIDYEKNKSKLHILEREFKEAERVEEKRQQEEREMRVRSNCNSNHTSRTKHIIFITKKSSLASSSTEEIQRTGESQEI